MSKRSLYEQLVHGFDLTELNLARLAGVLVYLMAMAVFIEVVTRRFHVGVLGIYEGVELGLVPAAFFTVSWIQKGDHHIRLKGLLTGHLPKKLRSFIDLIPLILSLIVYILIAWRCGAQSLWALGIGKHTMGLLPFPYWPYYATITVGSFVVSIRLLLQLKEAIFNHKFPGEDSA